MRILKILCFLSFLLYFSGVSSSDFSDQCPARRTDSFLRQYAFKNLTNLKTGNIYEGTVPANLTGITISALRLRTGNLRIKGVQFKQFQIPAGVNVTPYVERLVLVQQNSGNWSSNLFELEGYFHLTPVLGLLAYNDLNLSATILPELEFTASENPISVKFPNPKSAPKGSKPMCVKFDLQGLVSFNKVILGDTCLTYNQGHFSIVAESIAPTTTDQSEQGLVTDKKRKVIDEIVVVGLAIGGLILIMLFCLFILCTMRWNCGTRIGCFEKGSEVGGLVKMKCIGIWKGRRGSSGISQHSLEIVHGV